MWCRVGRRGETVQGRGGSMGDTAQQSTVAATTTGAVAGTAAG